MSETKHCRNQVGVPQQTRRIWSSDKEQSSTCGKDMEVRNDMDEVTFPYIFLVPRVPFDAARAVLY
jgi:hypothetical protein